MLFTNYQRLCWFTRNLIENILNMLASGAMVAERFLVITILQASLCLNQDVIQVWLLEALLLVVAVLWLFIITSVCQLNQIFILKNGLILLEHFDLLLPKVFKPILFLEVLLLLNLMRELVSLLLSHRDFFQRDLVQLLFQIDDHRLITIVENLTGETFGCKIDFVCAWFLVVIHI
jgi:hypothetical protein